MSITNPKVLIIGATHGDELLGTKLYPYILRKHPELLEYVDFIVGNPKAYAQKVRYTQSDLNRCYGKQGSTYEHARARYIAHYINITKPDLVLDMHTTTCIQPSCLIINDLAGALKKRFLRASSIDILLQVKPLHDITSIKQNVIGYEIPKKCVSTQALEAICQDILRFSRNTTHTKTKQLYKMKDKIYKKDISNTVAKTFVNFEKHELGFIPIMTGENSYKKHTDYLGFKASGPEKITL